MATIFISYRREGDGWTRGLAADLRRELPGYEIFHDIASIEIGEDFVESMRRSLASCALAIVVIGPRWLDARDDSGKRRLDDPEDHVRLEVEEALCRDGLRVVPVLVGGASMPKAADLPEPLKPLARRNAHEITDRRWDFDVQRLAESLKKIPAIAGAPESPPPEEKSAKTTTRAPRASTVPARLAPGTVFRDADDCPEMVVIPPGEFAMGSPEGEKGREDERPQHKVTLSRPFAVGKYEITFDEWDACVAAGGCAHRPIDQGWGRGRRPVIAVSWHDAQEYVSWLSKRTGKPYRLLSEAEWEYTARAGTTTRYPWGDEPGSNRANFQHSGSQWSGEQTAPVGSFEANAFGLHDMIGNVREWVQDCYHDGYNGAPGDGSAWESGGWGSRIMRGGSWLEGPEVVRSAIRAWVPPVFRSLNGGFRVARTL